VAGPRRRDDALELARVDRARVAHRVLVHERALADVGDDLGLLGCVARDIAAWRKAILVERLDRSKAIGEAIGLISRIERPPDLPPTVGVVVARFSSAEADHGSNEEHSSSRTVESSHKFS
jgi:hypothetical protein